MVQLFCLFVYSALTTTPTGKKKYYYKFDTPYSKSVTTRMKILNNCPAPSIEIYHFSRLFGVHRDSLPQIRSSAELYGVVKNDSILDGIRISGVSKRTNCYFITIAPGAI